jgi:hypothetical protein
MYVTQKGIINIKCWYKQVADNAAPIVPNVAHKVSSLLYCFSEFNGYLL